MQEWEAVGRWLIGCVDERHEQDDRNGMGSATALARVTLVMVLLAREILRRPRKEQGVDRPLAHWVRR